MQNLPNLSTFELSKKNVMITGASKGLGAVCAEYFIAQGSNVCIVASNLEKAQTIRSKAPTPQNHLALSIDYFDLKSIQATTKEALNFFSNKIDVILHTAGGGMGLKEPLINGNDLHKLYMLNIGAAAEINSIVVPYMIAQRKGNLVHVGSIAGKEAVGSVGYNTVKAGLNAYVKSLGRELAKDEVIACGFNPGGFMAPENSMARLQNNHPEAFRHFVETRLPRGRVGEASELLPLVHLLSTKAASMMIGSMVSIDAGEGKGY